MEYGVQFQIGEDRPEGRTGIQDFTSSELRLMRKIN